MLLLLLYFNVARNHFMRSVNYGSSSITVKIKTLFFMRVKNVVYKILLFMVFERNQNQKLPVVIL